MDKWVYVSNVQRFCVHDGPGIRTVVFLTGCSLRCKWCQNPETYLPTPQLMYNRSLCTSCGLCISGCPNHAISPDPAGGVFTDPQLCQRSFQCTLVCPFRARQASSKRYTVQQLFDEVVRDAVFFKNSRGGVTLSGGEPLVHPDFCLDLLTGLQGSGFHTAVETCGAVPWESVERVIPVVDLFLYDLKLMSPEKHAEWTGRDNSLILANVTEIVRRGRQVIIRVPLVPGVNDDDNEFGKIADFAGGTLSLQELHILPFHQLGSSKYDLLGKNYEMAGAQEENGERIDACRKLAEDRGLRVSIGGAGFN